MKGVPKRLPNSLIVGADLPMARDCNKIQRKGVLFTFACTMRNGDTRLQIIFTLASIARGAKMRGDVVLSLLEK